MSTSPTSGPSDERLRWLSEAGATFDAIDDMNLDGPEVAAMARELLALRERAAKLERLGLALRDDIADRHDIVDRSDGTAGPNEWMGLSTAHDEFFAMLGGSDA